MFTTWLSKVYEDNYPDEMGIYCLSHLFTIMFTSDYCWSTLENTITNTDQEVGDESDVKLVYLGTCKYGEIKEI